MGETLKQFGIQWPLLVASIINFVILLYLLKSFLYKPILKVLDERKETIAKSLQNAEEIEKERIKMEERVKSSLRLANEEAMRLIAQAHKTAETSKDQILKEAEKQAEKIAERAKAEIAQEREETTKQIKKETATMISVALKHILKETKGIADEDKLVDEALEKING